jgi:hypothetical protein
MKAIKERPATKAEEKQTIKEEKKEKEVPVPKKQE